MFNSGTGGFWDVVSTGSQSAQVHFQVLYAEQTWKGRIRELSFVWRGHIHFKWRAPRNLCDPQCKMSEETAQNGVIVGDTIIDPDQQGSNYEDARFGGFIFPDAASSHRRLSSRWAEVLGLLLPMLCLRAVKVVKAVCQWRKPVGSETTGTWWLRTRSRAARHGVTAAEYSAYLAVTFLCRPAFETCFTMEEGGPFRSRRGLVSGVPGHSAFSTKIYGVILRSSRGKDDLVQVRKVLFKSETTAICKNPTEVEFCGLKLPLMGEEGTRMGYLSFKSLAPFLRGLEIQNNKPWLRCKPTPTSYPSHTVPTTVPMPWFELEVMTGKEMQYPEDHSLFPGTRVVFPCHLANRQRPAVCYRRKTSMMTNKAPKVRSVMALLMGAYVDPARRTAGFRLGFLQGLWGHSPPHGLRPTLASPIAPGHVLWSALSVLPPFAGSFPLYV